MRGAYIEAISQNPDEKEYLIPQTQIQLTSYAVEGGKHVFDARLVSELGSKEKQGFEPISILVNTRPLQYADPKQVISLLGKGEISPSHAIEAFPDHVEICLAAYHKDRTAIQYASRALIAALGDRIHPSPKASASESSILPNKHGPSIFMHHPKPSEGAPEIIPIASDALHDLGHLQAAIASKIFKIKNAFRRSGEPHEGFIKELCLDVCKTKDIEPLSALTEEAAHLIHIIKEDPELSMAMGIDLSKPINQIDSDIRDLMKRAIAQQSLFPDTEPPAKRRKNN